MLSAFKNIVRKKIPHNIYNALHIVKTAIIAQKELRITSNYSSELSAVEKKEKIVLVFIIYMPEVFSSFQSIYENACENKKFVTYIIAQPHVSAQQGLMWENPAFEYLRNSFHNVIKAYENGKWFDLKSLAPDYVFYARPYLSHYYIGYNPKIVRQYAKICYHAYSYDMDKNADFYEVYNYPFLSNVSFVFNSAQSSANRVTKMICGRGKYPQVLCFGFSRFDLIQRKIEHFSGKQNGKKTVLWIPRWTAEKSQGKKQGHFFKYINSFLSYAECNKELMFIIRPHPLMFANFLNLGLCTQEYIDTFYNKCNDLGNIIIDNDKDYFSSLIKADIMLADYSALIVEFFVMGKPIIYCDDASTFNEETKKMDSVLYHAKEWNDIETKLHDLLNNNDELKNRREEQIVSMMKNKNVGKQIVDFIEQDYLNN